jgi:hypothetical protein
VPGSADYREKEQATAKERGWEFEEIDGNIDLLLRLVNGDWIADDFLVIPAGYTIKACHDDSIVETVL